MLERKSPPTFDVLVEIRAIDDMVVYREVAGAVDTLLRGEEPLPEHRSKDADGQVHIEQTTAAEPTSMEQVFRTGVRRAPSMSRNRNGQAPAPREGREREGGGRERAPRRPETAAARPGQPMVERADQFAVVSAPQQQNRVARIFPFGVSRNRLEKAIERLRVPATIVRDIDEATVVMTLKNHYRQNPSRLQHAEEDGVPVYVLRSNTQTQMETMLADVFNVVEPPDPMTDAMIEAEEAIGRLINGAIDQIELRPQAPFIRRLQHEMAERYNLQSESRGKEPHRFVRISR